MTSNAHLETRILGSLRSADGKGVVRIEDRYDPISTTCGRTPAHARPARAHRAARHRSLGPTCGR